MSHPFGERSMGDGLVSLIDQNKWKHKRNLYNHGFQRRFSRSSNSSNLYSTIMKQLFSSHFNFWMKEINEKCDILMERFRLMADGKTLVTFYDELSNFALDTISSVSFATFAQQTIVFY